MKARARSFLTVNITAIIVGSIVVLGLLFLRRLFHPGLFVFTVIVLVLYMMIDYLLWLQRGIRRIELYDDRIVIYRGTREKSRCIQAGTITNIDVFSKLNRHVVNIMLGGKVDRPLPGVTLFSGPRVRITDDAFDEAQFQEFIIHLHMLFQRK
jgi:hypothetical protein